MGNKRLGRPVSVSRSRSLVVRLRATPQDVVVSVGHATRCSGDQAPITPSRPPFKREVEVPTQSVHPLSTTSTLCTQHISVQPLPVQLRALLIQLSTPPYTPLLPLYAPSTPFSLFGTSLYQKLPVQPCKPLCYHTQLSLCLCLKNRGTSLLVLIVLKVLLGPHHPSRVTLITPVPPLLFSGHRLFLFFLLQTSLLLLSLFLVWITLQERELGKQAHQKWLL